MSVEQFLGLYNYWVVIFLMMTGFYIVIARNNLIKTVIGLNIFQISVILLYVSIGKVSAGTAPIVPPALVSHGHTEVAHGDHASHGHSAHHVDGHSAGVKKKNGKHADADQHDHGHADDHDKHDGHAHDHDSSKLGATGQEGESSDDSHDSSHEPTHDSHAIVYSNPLPSVLMLTAIVVGIATTALALALIVRIREDYGTIEEDEILELDRAA